MKEKYPPALTGRKDDPDALDQFVREEMVRMRRLDGMVMGRHCGIKERRAALAEIKGMCLRLGSMLLKSPEMIAAIEPEIVAETKAKGAATARTVLHPHSEKRDPIINEALQANPKKPRKLLAKELNAIFQRHDPPLPPVNVPFLDKRASKLRKSSSL